MTGPLPRLARALQDRLRPPLPPAPRRAALRPALVIPVRDDAAGLDRLLAQVRALDTFAQIVVVDDGSDPPVAPAPDITLLRHAQPLGGGVARNAGLAAVQSAHLMFLDADDLPGAGLPDLLCDLGQQAAPFDFCLFKYADSRVSAEEIWGQPDWDERFWEAAGLAIGALRAAPPPVWPLLAQTANYPWNKIYRTAFLRDNGIGCAATPLHQDIALHWGGFLAARHVLVSDRICVWHHVSAAGTRLSNRAGPERLAVFAGLAPAVAAAERAGPVWQAALACFSLGLLDWSARQIDPALQGQLRSAERDWLAQSIAPWLPAIDARDPALATQIRARMAAP